MAGLDFLDLNDLSSALLALGTRNADHRQLFGSVIESGQEQ